MISFEKALEYIVDNCQITLPYIDVLISQSLDSISVENVVSDCFIPPFNNSAMDGFAVKFTDLDHGLNELDIIGSNFAGDEIGNGSGGAWEIMTGAVIPDGYDTVIKIEDVQIIATDDGGQPKKITINLSSLDIKFGNNIREAGQDFKIGDMILTVGDKINAAHIAALATVGIAEVKVFDKAKISIISTGREIIDDANIALKSGQIRNSNGPNLMATFSSMNVDVKYAGTIADEINDYETCIKSLIEKSDIIISTGAVSMGRHDFIPQSLERLGANIIFHKCKIRPGKPILFAKFAPSKQNPNGTYYFGLPGNPISANVGVRFFVYALLNRLQGKVAEKATKAKLTSNVIKSHDFKMFYKAFASLVDSSLCVDILSGQESFKIKPMLKANCWAVFEPNQHHAKTNDLVNIYPMNSEVWAL